VAAVEKHTKDLQVRAGWEKLQSKIIISNVIEMVYRSGMAETSYSQILSSQTL
jgi:hypothetical protein